MYRIQAFNVITSHIEIFKIMSWEYPDLMSKLKQSGSYGLIEAEYIARF
jgi:hypothetical protein